MGARRLIPFLVLAGLLAASAGCADDSAPRSVRLITHESFALTQQLLDDFTAETGITVEVATAGDAGALVNRAVLAAGNPEGDLLFGVDNTLLSRLSAAGAIDSYQAPADGVAAELTDLAQGVVTPIDFADVCLNVDQQWFTERGIPAPTAVADLTDARYRELTVMPNPATSSPGLAFLLSTVELLGDPAATEQPAAWQQFWERMRSNGMLVVAGWTEAYTGSYTAGGGSGQRPIVVSYATSPPAELVYADEPRPQRPRTAVVEDGCFRQVEFAAVLAGSPAADEARLLADYLLTAPVQADLPLSMFVLPAVTATPLPAEFEFAARPAAPVVMDPAVIDRGRDAWIEQWTRIVLR
jgi:thiamine transport system substrate-binding protein